MATRRVAHVLRWLCPDTRAQRGEEVLTAGHAAALRALWGRAADDPLLGSYPVGPEEEAALGGRVAHAIDRDRYLYLIEPTQLEE